MPGVKAVISHENCTVLWGAWSISGGAQSNEDIKKITKHRRYAFNNPVRFVGEPVAAVAAVDRHTAEEALQLIAVDYDDQFRLQATEISDIGADRDLTAKVCAIDWQAMTQVPP